MEPESAIPEWLRIERTVQARAPERFRPSYELYTSRFPRETKDLVLAVIGAQYKIRELDDGAAIRTISSFISSASTPEPSRPRYHDYAAVTDNRGFFNIAILAYWTSKQAYDDWFVASGFGAWWAEDVQGEDHGWFLEVFYPSIDRLETVLTTTAPEGVSRLGESVSGPIQEHVYWGSMRDRLPIAQTDELLGDPDVAQSPKPAANGTVARPVRIRVQGRKNLAVIRSGQDWSVAEPEERQLYIDSMQPPLVRGMAFLGDHGDEVGCFSCRFMEVVAVDPSTGVAGKGSDKTFCLAYFDNLSSLERWSREHRTHLAIFAEFGRYAKTVGDRMSLRLFHEVFVLEPQQQVFEYVGCHDGTGMLTSL
ncbi:phenylacetaldoxime dehydratase [Colletotrichum plurivorum]|uniref:Phenylacetaldoxime dehydratase n=1 Tax=Colletotrichum plurivorum TaxID=2175906 RepID=A0A8H6MUX1_9PEZI|nr:phenylacetaldoxime dehydratase [Colletotrichum plurivorum]